ncbi:MAG: AarF/UbiB family protein [Candidatus Gastranaerophilales bacterium]
MSGNLINSVKQTTFTQEIKKDENELAQKAVAKSPVTQNTNTTTLKSDVVEFQNKLADAQKRNGIVEKVYDSIKNATKLGQGSNKIKSDIVTYEQGNKSKDEVELNIKKYENSQETAEQITGDLASSAVGVSTFYMMKNKGKNLVTKSDLNALPEEITSTLKLLGKDPKKIATYLKSNKALVPMVLASGLLAGLTKRITLGLNRIGSDEFSMSKEDKAGKSKKEIKAERKVLNREKRRENRRNFLTGSLNGILAPITAIGGGIVGVPAFVAANSATRYMTSKHSIDDKKSLKGYTDDLKNNAILNTAGTLALAVPAFKKANYSKVLFNNLDKVKTKLAGVKLQDSGLGNETAYKTLERTLLESKGVRDIMYSGKPVDEVITELTNHNLFAVKFKQIQGNGDSLAQALKESCPPTRTMEEAQTQIDKLLGHSDYSVSKLLGVGTVAESYLAKGKDGKEVCIKILKDGISSEKIMKDKEAFIKLVTNGVEEANLNEEQKYLLRNIENMADGLLKEVDLENEMKAAQKLRTFTSKAKVVNPIEVKEGVYVMEKADGISLDTLSKYWNLKREGSQLFGSGRDVSEEMAKLRAKSPDFDDFDLSEKDIKKLLNEYISIQIEQFNKIEKGGKTLHADIHPGNIFVDLKALKSGKGKAFTLIDTGNTIDMSRMQAAKSIKLTTYIDNGNLKDLTDIVCEGAILPKGMSAEDAKKLVSEDLKKIFFDSSTQIDSMNNDTFLAMATNVMRKHNIIMDDTQLSLNKAKISADNSLNDLIKGLLTSKFSNIDKPQQAIGAVTSTLADGAKIWSEQTAKIKLQETMNLFKMSFKEAMAHIKNPNMLKTNSEDYLTYKIKQDIPRESNSFFDIFN